MAERNPRQTTGRATFRGRRATTCDRGKQEAESTQSYTLSWRSACSAAPVDHASPGDRPAAVSGAFPYSRMAGDRMTDAEYDVLVTIAQAPVNSPADSSGKLQSSLALDVLALLSGERARGAAAGAWLVLVQQEARRTPKRKAAAS